MNRSNFVTLSLVITAVCFLGVFYLSPKYTNFVVVTAVVKVEKVCDPDHDNIPNTQENCNDLDGDGETNDTDCNSGNRYQSHFLTEVCDNGVDNDCDGLTDRDDLDCIKGMPPGAGKENCRVNDDTSEVCAP